MPLKTRHLKGLDTHRNLSRFNGVVGESGGKTRVFSSSLDHRTKLQVGPGFETTTRRPQVRDHGYCKGVLVKVALKAIRGLLVTDFINLNHGQMTRMEPKLFEVYVNIIERRQLLIH
ncbi:hypothetical protein TNCV_859821 [Trichonephila clavipes]|nr:hypothetical protein TNCV_859821 [Trichonephila clavipes]